MKHSYKSLLLGAVAATSLSTAAEAATFVGSWTVDQGPSWSVVPVAYSGTDVAALLFGGAASDYAISTISSDTSMIDNLAWVSTWGGGACNGNFPCGTKVAESFVNSTGGNYQNVGDTSAYVNDWAVGAQFVNYAFRIDTVAAVPEPATWALMLLGFGFVGGALRSAKRRQKVTVSYA